VRRRFAQWTPPAFVTIALGTVLLGMLAGVGACRRRVPDPERAAMAARARHPDPTPFNPFADLDGKAFYLCCNMRFNANRDASDANYAYPEVQGYTLHAGTQVHVVRVHWNDITIQPEGIDQTFNIDFRFGTQRMNGRQYFHKILLETDPTAALADAPPDVVKAVRQGQLLPGMTKEQALLARGYPPFHHTAGIESHEWMYYQSPGFVHVVRFVDGKIRSIARGAAP
jgi:hypothetical protein